MILSIFTLVVIVIKTYNLMLYCIVKLYDHLFISLDYIFTFISYLRMIICNYIVCTRYTVFFIFHHIDITAPKYTKYRICWNSNSSTTSNTLKFLWTPTHNKRAGYSFEFHLSITLTVIWIYRTVTDPKNWMFSKSLWEFFLILYWLP